MSPQDRDDPLPAAADADMTDSVEVRVSLGSSAFRRACVEELTWAGKMTFLQDVDMVHRQPGWIDALREAGAFSVHVSPADRRPGLVEREDEAIARLALAMTRHAEVARVDRLRKDPVTGDLLSGMQHRASTVIWSPGLRLAFQSVVAEFLVQADPVSRDCAEAEHLGVLAFHANAALLLAAACAGGDAATAHALVSRFPSAARLPLSVALLHGQVTHAQSSDKMTAPMLAVFYNQRVVLESFPAEVWSPLERVYLPYGSAYKALTLQPCSLALSVPSMLALGSDAVTRCHPHTAAFFFDRFVARAQAIDPDGVTPLDRQERTAMVECSAAVISGAHSCLAEYLPALARSGVLRELANDLVATAASHLNVPALEAMRPGLDWSVLQGASFPPWAAMNHSAGAPAKTGRSNIDVATMLGHWCVEDGHGHMLAEVRVKHDGNDFPVGWWLIATGATDLLVMALERGMDPKPATLASIADGVGPHMGAIVRSFAAQEVLRNIIDSGELDAGRPAPRAAAAPYLRGHC